MNTEMIVLPAMFGTFGFIVWVVANAWQRRQQVKVITELNTRLVDRIGSIKDFSDFLQTDGGARFMDTLTVEHGSLGPRDRILRTTQIGIIVIAVALGFILVGGWFIASDEHQVLTSFGLIALALGFGCLAAAAVSYRLAGILGVLDRRGRSSDANTPRR